ncbi:hypothetical protein [Peribacillus deserti]|uniref:hypothetical protein n=1 Tax=Peribacillus deserti TaxID=673318 RepID=UPI0015E10AC3|nr:hypothetical protein [Peribacillus deserti]
MAGVLTTAFVVLMVFIVVETGISRWLNSEDKPQEARTEVPERRYRSEVQSKL